MELHTAARRGLRPDPEMDAIEALFYRVVVEGEEGGALGCVAVGHRLEGLLSARRVGTEVELVRAAVRLVRDADPDVLAGWEVQQASWGFLLARAAALGTNLCPLLARVPGSARESKVAVEAAEAGGGDPALQHQVTTTSGISIVGRTVFNLWRVLRAEVALYSYTLENVARVVLGERRPTFPPGVLARWWADARTRPRVVEHLAGRLEAQAAILHRLDLLARSSELARLFGIQLAEVFSRGTQFRVESSMLRLAKPANFVPVSPSRQQLAGQAAPEYLALLLEPESKMYTDPVVVLDFQSLYPSIMIAYNYCFTTCLGRVPLLAQPGPHEFGCSQLRVSAERLAALQGRVTVSPGGVAFLRPEVRRGVLPRMLEDILGTRIMVKAAMKKHKADPQLQKLLHSRQLGLKLIANVTYGYTSANFSGRMPCIEVGDSVVSKGREALERAIRTIEEHPAWGARVVYGDTDSVFVLLPGRSKLEAFDIGEEMARVVTQDNPKPMKLKFEKVYLPCLLQTKKRYVGYMWETRDQAKPIYDAKGIETVRRDGIPATVKILEKTLRILFDTSDVSLVKRYVQAQFRKVLAGTVSLQDLTFAKEFRGLAGYRPAACVPALELTRQAMQVDRRAVPRAGERVPYVVVYGEPGLPLIQLVRPPAALLDQPHLRINGLYYLTKVIGPPLNRCLLLLGADCLAWLQELPRAGAPAPVRPAAGTGGQVISQYFVARRCAACSSPAVRPLCPRCQEERPRAALLLSCRAARLERARERAEGECRACCGPAGQACATLDCPAMYRRRTEGARGGELVLLRGLLDGLEL
jgi:DNA polymerase zeta